MTNNTYERINMWPLFVLLEGMRCINVETKKCITEEEIILLDEQEKFVPLTYDKLFKGIFKDNLELLKLFILDQLEFNIEPNECKIECLIRRFLNIIKVNIRRQLIFM